MLDGNPIDESGCVHLCQALLKNAKVQSLSLRRCGLGDQSGSLVLRLMAEKPGLEVDATAGNHCGEEMSRKVGKTVDLRFLELCLRHFCSAVTPAGIGRDVLAEIVVVHVSALGLFYDFKMVIQGHFAPAVSCGMRQQLSSPCEEFEDTCIV